jgi:cyanophycinase
MIRASSIALVAFVALRPAVAEERLVLLGGGPHPREAMTRFVEWAGGREARVLVVPWASSEPKASAKDIVEEVRALGAGQAEAAPRAPLKEKTRARFVAQLAAATGVFFTGGDQSRIMDVLRDLPLLEGLRERFRGGIVFGGTSAGTAIMSARMITGNGDFTVIDGSKVETRPGLGLLRGVIVDQHFVKRQRENRLFGLILRHPEERGVGIDEGTAVLVRGGREAEVVGAGTVVLVDAQGDRDALLVTFVRAGARFDVLPGPRSGR